MRQCLYGKVGTCPTRNYFYSAGQPRSMDPSKDLAAYGYGSVAWKERMEIWKQKQEKLQVSRSENGSKDWDNDGDGPDLPLYDPVTSLELTFIA